MKKTTILNVKVGETVNSKMFGTGRVVAIVNKDNGGRNITVDFGENGIKEMYDGSLTNANGDCLRTVQPSRKHHKKAVKSSYTTEEMTYMTKTNLINLYQQGEYRHYQLAFEVTIENTQAAAEKKGDFVASICATVLRSKRMSEKQAYCIARFMVNNGVRIEPAF